MSINFENYKVFYYVAKYGSISAAARELYISQPAASSAIKVLESSLDTALFLRTTKGVKLTTEGEALFSYVAKGCDYLFKGEEIFSEISDLKTGEIRVGASSAVLQFLLLPILEEFNKQYPKIIIRIINGSTSETIEKLRQGEIDFGIVVSPIPSHNFMQVREIASFQNVFVAGKRFQHLKYRTVPLGTLKLHPLIMMQYDHQTRKYIDEYMADYEINLEPQFELASGELISEFAARGLGIGCVLKNYAQPMIEKGQLFELSLERPLPARSVAVVTNNKIPPSTSARSLLGMILG